MADTYTVYAYDLNTNTPLAELPASGLQFTSRLNDAGNCSFNMQLSDPRIQAISPRTVTAPWKVALYIDRDGVLVWGGIITNRSIDSSTRVATIQAREFLCWTDQRVIASDYDSQTLMNLGYIQRGTQTSDGITASNFVGAIDPAILLRMVFQDAVTAKGGIGISIPSTTTNLPKLQPGYRKSQFTTISQVINDITGMIMPGYGGLDVAVQVAWGAGGTAPTKALVLSAPRAGRVGTQSGIVFDLGKAISWSWPEDGTQFGTDMTITGASTGNTPITGTDSANQPTGGLGQTPRLDLISNHPNLLTQDAVQKMASAYALMYGQPLATPQATFPTADLATPLGTWIIGDDARVLAPMGDEWFPNGLDQVWRIVGHTVTVPNEGVPTAALTFNIPPIF